MSMRIEADQDDEIKEDGVMIIAVASQCSWKESRSLVLHAQLSDGAYDQADGTTLIQQLQLQRHSLPIYGNDRRE